VNPSTGSGGGTAPKSGDGTAQESGGGTAQESGGGSPAGAPVICRRRTRAYRPRAIVTLDVHGATAASPSAKRSHSMFERFTDRARRVVVLAQEEAKMLNHNYIGTEHILLGLIHEGEGVAAKA